jgi:hypothetical protein
MAARGHDLQVECGEGPCIDAVWEERVISAPDLTQDGRWPSWAHRAVDELGVRSMLCLRMFTHEDRVGALNLFSDLAHAFTPDDVDTGIAVAAHSAVAVAATNKIDQLHFALDSRTVIGQATGLMMGVYGIDSDAAWNLLRRLSSTENSKLVDVAAELVRHHNAEPGRGHR